MDRLAKLFDDAIHILQEYEPQEGYYLAFSGGKDSIVIYDLMVRSRCKFDAHFNFTSVDPPELTKFVKDNYPDVIWHRPKLTMFQLIEKRGVPSLWRRWCCKELKEREGSNRLVVTGIRKAESPKRAKRSMFEISKTDKTKRFIHIIIEWKTKDVWDYIKKLDIKYCQLYDNGWTRIGCIGCPAASKNETIKHFIKYPNYKKAYIHSIQKCINRKPSKHFGTDAELFFEWWISKLSTRKFFGLREQTEIEL